MACLVPVMKTKCATCPFRPRSEYAHLAGYLAASAITEASRLCHSTGSSAINARTGKPPRICRGARDVQLRAMAAMGVIAEPTDKAWSDASSGRGGMRQHRRSAKEQNDG